MSSPVAIVLFPELVINGKAFDKLGGELPRTLFEIDKIDDRHYSCYYAEADQRFDGGSILEVSMKIVNFQHDDETVATVGKEVVEMINIPKRI